MPANIKEVFDNFPRELKENKKKSNQVPVINYEDIVQKESNYVPYETHVYSNYTPKPRKPVNKPRVSEVIAQPVEDSVYSYQYMSEEPQFRDMYKNMEEKVTHITCKEIDKHVSECKDCQKKMVKEKVVYIKDKKQEMSQEIMELITFLATGVFIILVLDKL